MFKKDLLVVALLAVILTPLFWIWPIDLTLMRWFYEPGAIDNVWPHQDFWLWKLFYVSAGAMSALFAIGGLVLFVVFRRRQGPSRLWATRGLLFTALVIIGSGLIVNAGLKDHTGRFRPRQVVELGGQEQYQPPLQFGEAGMGKSFPAGHPSSGFTLFALWFIYRRSNPRRAKVYLGATIVLGTMMGLGRMAAGGHFPSDVLWSGLVMYLTGSALCYGLLRLPKQELALARHEPVQKLSGLQRLLVSGALAGVVVGAFFANPMHKTWERALGADLQTLVIQTSHSSISIQTAANNRILLETRSFGLPTNKLQLELEDNSPESLKITYETLGTFSDLETQITIFASPELIEHIEIEGEDNRIQGLDE